MAIDERDYMRDSARRIVEATYNPREFRFLGSSRYATPVNRHGVWVLKVLVWFLISMALFHLFRAYHVGEKKGQNSQLCHTDKVTLQDVTFTRVSAGVVEARGYLTSACDTSARVKLLVEVADQTGHTVGRHEVIANFGQPVPPHKTTAIVQPIAVLDQPGQSMWFSIQVHAVDGGAP